MVIVEKIRKYTQHQDSVASEMGVSRVYLNEILNGKKWPGKNFIKKAEVWLEQQIKTD